MFVAAVLWRLLFRAYLVHLFAGGSELAILITLVTDFIEGFADLT